MTHMEFYPNGYGVWMEKKKLSDQWKVCVVMHDTGGWDFLWDSQFGNGIETSDSQHINLFKDIIRGLEYHITVRPDTRRKYLSRRTNKVERRKNSSSNSKMGHN